jgi:hypothetical protein
MLIERELRTILPQLLYLIDVLLIDPVEEVDSNLITNSKLLLYELGSSHGE